MSRSTSRQSREEVAEPEPEVDDAGSDSEGEEEEEYEVEAIVDHRQEKGKFKYLVAWKGYGPEHNTWEPQENVEHSQEIVSAYWEKQPKVGNITKRGAPAAPAPASTSNKRKRPVGRPSAAREPSVEQVHYSDTHRDEMSKYQDVKDWEDMVRSIDTVERTSKNGLIVYITMKGGERFGVSNDMVNKRCPQTMLRFYEGHLKWRGGE